MKARFIGFLKFLAYPAFYVFALVLCGYFAFPYARLKDRIIAEFERKGKPGERLEIEHLSSYWFTGIEASGVKLVLPKAEEVNPFKAASDDDGKDAAPKETVLALDELHARIRILPLLLGRVRVSFFVSGLGGEVKGVVPMRGSKGDVDVEFEGIEIGKIEPLAAALGGVPLSGSATGHVSLSPEDGKLSHATGSIELAVSNLVVSDGKTKIQGIIELPAAKVGDLALSATANDGVITVNKLQANGTDLEIGGLGKVALHDAWRASVSDLFVHFKFTDAYRGKSDVTKTLLGTPGSTAPGIIEMQVGKLKRAKRADGGYGFHMHGPLKKLQFDPSPSDSATTASGASTAAPPPPILPPKHNAKIDGSPAVNRRPMTAGAAEAQPPTRGGVPDRPGSQANPAEPEAPAAAEPEPQQPQPQPEPEPAQPQPEPAQPAE